jgi:hypothetical protein
MLQGEPMQQVLQQYASRGMGVGAAAAVWACGTCCERWSCPSHNIRHNEHFEGSPLGLACELRVRHLPLLYAQRSSPCLRMHAAQHNCRFPLALRMLQLCNPSYVRCAGDLVTTLGALLRRLLDISARSASLAALFPPPPGWQEPPPYPLLLAAQPPEKAAGVEGPRPKSARGEGACMGTCGQLRHSVAQHTAFIAFP